MPVSPIPKHLNSITPLLTFKHAEAAIEFYKEAFGATLLSRIDAPNRQVMHAELLIGNSVIFISDELAGRHAHPPRESGESSIHMELYVENVDAMFRRALSAGAQRSLEPNNMFWGDRYAQVTDPFGYVWGLATHIEDVSQAEEKQRAHDYWLALAGGGA